MNNTLNTLKICILLISLCSIFSSCEVCNRWHSNERYMYEVMDWLYVFDNDRNDSIKQLEVHFGFHNSCSYCSKREKEEMKSSPATLDYSFYISASSHRVSSPVMPNVKINSFSFTDKKGNIIPSVLYVQLIKTPKTVINMPLESLTDEVKNETHYDGMLIKAKSNQSCYNTKLFYVDYDIEVGNKRYSNHIKYKRKWIFDINVH